MVWLSGVTEMCGGDGSKWYRVAHAVFWAERITIQKAMGYSPYFLAHGVELLLPFDLTEATYLAPLVTTPLSLSALLALRAQQLLKRDKDLKRAAAWLLASRFRSADVFVRAHCTSIHQRYINGDACLARLCMHKSAGYARAQRTSLTDGTSFHEGRTRLALDWEILGKCEELRAHYEVARDHERSGAT